MGYSNYPDGMRESDLPGWNDRECPECEESGTADDGSTCSYCDGTGVVDSREYDRRKYDEHLADYGDYDD